MKINTYTFFVIQKLNMVLDRAEYDHIVVLFTGRLWRESALSNSNKMITTGRQMFDLVYEINLVLIKGSWFYASHIRFLTCEKKEASPTLG